MEKERSNWLYNAHGDLSLLHLQSSVQAQTNTSFLLGHTGFGNSVAKDSVDQ